MALPLIAHSASIAQQEYDSVLHSKRDSVHGKKLFESCATCHGPDGAGTSDGTVPAIAGQHFRVLARELVDFRHVERWDERMEAFTDAHQLGGVRDIADVAVYVNSLQAVRTLGQGSAKFLQQGASLYVQRCASCHGASAEGDDAKGYPRLAGQHYLYLLRQLNNAGEFRRRDFPGEHVQLLKEIGQADLVGVADYLSRLGP